MAEIVDLSHPLDSTTTIYPGDPKYSCCPALTLEKDGVNVHSLSLGTHSGTHIDAPYHFFQDGETVDKLTLSRCKGPTIVLEVTRKRPRERIIWADIEKYEDALRSGAFHGAIVLFRTGWSQYWGTDAYFDHPFLDEGIARKLVEIGIHFIGIDTLSPDETHVGAPDSVEQDFTVHKVLLAKGIIIAENLTNLKDIQDGWIACMAPLKIVGGDGSPVRAFAWKETL